MHVKYSVWSAVLRFSQDAAVFQSIKGTCNPTHKDLYKECIAAAAAAAAAAARRGPGAHSSSFSVTACGCGALMSPTTGDTSAA